jgi:DNA-binding NarL/FixJ family response regulator
MDKPAPMNAYAKKTRPTAARTPTPPPPPSVAKADKVEPSRIVIIEDQTAIRELMTELLEAQEQNHVVAEAADGIAGLEALLHHRPQLLILDVLLPKLSGIDVLRRLGKSLPETRILIFSAKQDPQIVRGLVQGGIHGFVNKSAPLSELRQAVNCLLGGGTWFSEDFSRTAREALASPYKGGDAMADLLTPREREIAVLIASSHSSKEVASKLSISIKTAENHRANLMRKLGVRDVAGLTRYVIRQGLLDPSL